MKSDKGKLTAFLNFGNSEEALTLETSAFQNSLRQLIYPYQFHFDC